MESTSDMAERHRRMLARLAEMGMEQAEKLHAAVVEAETPEQAAELSAAFHRISRSVRQTLALEARLERQQKLLPYEHARAQREDAIDRGRRRKAELQARTLRLIWTEAEGIEEVHCKFRLSDLLRDAELFEGFADQPLDEHITRLAREIGLKPTAPPTAHPREGGDPSGLSSPQAQPEPSSAWVPACAGMSGRTSEGSQDPSDPVWIHRVLTEIRTEAGGARIPGLEEALARCERLAGDRLDSG